MVRAFQTGEVTYNDFTFPGPVHTTLKVSVVRDSANRTTKYREYIFTVSCIVVPSDFQFLSAGADLDEGIRKLRVNLLRPGKVLKIIDQGYGNDLVVSASNCIGFGPVPESLDIVPVGSNLAHRLTWVVRFTVSECNDSEGIRLPTSHIGEYSYGINYSFDSRGLCTRTITGVMECLVTISGQYLTKTADDLIDGLTYAIPEGFTRVKSYNISNDKRYLHFTITDTELPSDQPYFPGMIHMDVTHTLRGSIKTAATWTIALSGTIEAAPGVAKSICWFAFVDLIDRVRESFFKYAKGTYLGDANSKPYLIIGDISVDNHLYTRAMNFSISFFAVCDIKTILAASGVWEPSTLKWKNWHRSMATVFSPRGYAKLKTPARDDIVLTFCDAPRINQLDTYSPNDPKPIAPRIYAGPTEDSSWIQYEVKPSIIKEADYIVQAPLGKTSSEIESLLSCLDNMNGGYVSGGGSADTASSPSRITQERSAGTAQFCIECYASRVKYPIKDNDLAKVLTIGGQPAKQVHEKIKHGSPTKRTPEGYPIYTVSWYRWYNIDRSSSQAFEISKLPGNFTVSPLEK